ncbi:MAG: collagen-like protein [Gemmatimonadota bacterium]
MKKTISGVSALLLSMTLGSVDATAQESIDERRNLRGPAVESIMSMRDRLELTDEQISALDELRAERVRERSQLRAEMDEMQSRLRAGQIPRSEMMAFMEQRREAASGDAEARRAEVNALLTESQVGMLDDLRSQARAFQRGRASARSGRGARGSRGVRGARGSRGERGFRGARGGWDRQGMRRGRGR